MPQNKTITVATDGSDHSLRVLSHAKALAANLGAAIELIRVVEPDDVSAEPAEAKDVATERARTRVEGEMHATLQRFGVTGTPRAIVAPGKPLAQTLLDEASDDLMLVMHTHGRGGIGRFLHGSVALGVLQQARIPVMLGGKELLEPLAETESYHLLATTDLSPDADHALRTLAPILELGKVEVTLLHVHTHEPGGADNDAALARCEAALAEKRALLPASVDVETQVRDIPLGAGVDTAILETADQINAQSILMGMHGQSARRTLALGNVAGSLLGRSHLPLIVTRVQA
jgi:nucleotide-binding universal stress UspA family protein